MNKKQVERMNNINKLMYQIGAIDRGFFNTRNGRAEFVELKTTVKYRDGYTQKEISIKEDGRVRGFSNGGTLLALVRDFKHYILTGKLSDGEHGYGGLYATCWGYTIDGMDAVVEFAKEVGYISNSNPSYKEYLISLYKNDSWCLSSSLKDSIEEQLINCVD